MAQFVQRARLLAPATVAVVVALGAGCGARFGDTREDVRDRLVEDLTSPGIPPELAVCVVEAFIEARSDAELQDFIDRAELTEAEREEIARLTRVCVDPGSG